MTLVRALPYRLEDYIVTHEIKFQTADKYVRRRIGTGVPALDKLLGGGYECGLMHLFYGHKSFQNDMLRAAVWAQIPESKGGPGCAVIIIDSSNMIDTLKLADYAFEFELNIDDVLENIFISRAFSSSQTYDLLTNHLDEFLERVPIGLLLVSGLPDLFASEGLDALRLQQITHASAHLMAKTLEYEIVTLISTNRPQLNNGAPSVGRALASNAQIHIQIEQSSTRSLYTLTKHPSLPIHTEQRMNYPSHYGVTLPLEYFFEGDLST